MDASLFNIISAVIIIIALLFVAFNLFNPSRKQRHIVITTFGKVTSVKEYDWFIIFPLIQKVHKVNIEQKFYIPSKEFYSIERFPVTFEAFCYFTVTDPKKFVANRKTFKSVFLEYSHQTMLELLSKKKMSEIIMTEKKAGQSAAYVINKDKGPSQFGILIRNFDTAMRFRENIEDASHWLNEEKNPYTYKLKKK